MKIIGCSLHQKEFRVKRKFHYFITLRGSTHVFWFHSCKVLLSFSIMELLLLKISDIALGGRVVTTVPLWIPLLVYTFSAHLSLAQMDVVISHGGAVKSLHHLTDFSVNDGHINDGDPNRPHQTPGCVESYTTKVIIILYELNTTKKFPKVAFLRRCLTIIIWYRWYSWTKGPPDSSFNGERGGPGYFKQGCLVCFSIPSFSKADY